MSEQEQADQVNVNIFDLIDSICAEFRRQWKEGARPRIESYLEKVPDEARENLFRNLLQAEIRSRRQAEESPSSDEYVNRFPAFKRLIRQAFDEPTLMSMEAALSTPDHGDAAQTITIDFPAANRIGDYELLRELGRGGFGVVYEAKHTKTDNRVALKTLPTGTDGQQVNAERLYRFRREFRSLSEINHPNLVGMQTLEVDGSQWFFTMDLIEGDDFLSYVRPDDQFDESRLRSCLAQLAKGVMELHRRGIIHRDLKPSNVLVSEAGRVTVLDFGLAAELQKATDVTQTRSGMFAGTPRYAAPEQMFGERTEASDWYAFGTMLYEALTGEAPFQGKDQVALLRQKQEQDPPPLAARKGLPSELAELADGLVRQEPMHRLIADEVGQRLGLNEDTRFAGSTKESHGSLGSVAEEDSGFGGPEDDEVVLIGREQQLAQLESIREEFLESRKPMVVWISGKSGEGKSSLAEKFLRPMRLGNEMLVLSGRCYDRESVPFKAIDSIIDPLTSYLRSKPTDWLAARLPKDFHLLAQLFPVLSRVKAIDEVANSDQSRIVERQVRFRAFYALREFFNTIGSATPLVVFLDDLQWGDSDSAEVILELLAHPTLPPILFVGGYRSDELASSPFIQQWDRLSSVRQAEIATRQVEVQPLTQEQCLQLLVDRVGSGAERLREQAAAVFSDTRGNPYLIEQLIEGFDSQTERLEHVPLDQVIERKLARLPRESTDLLQAIAIAGQAVSLEEASRVANLEAASVSLVTHMRSERLVRLVGTADRYVVDTYHDKIRETVLDRLDKRLSIEWHSRYADLLEAQSSINIEEVYQFLESADPYERFSIATERAFDLAYHFERAGNTEKAFGFYMLAAEQAAHSYANDEATAAFAQAEKMLSTDLAARIRYRLCLGIGQTHRRSKRTEEAIPKLEQAVELAERSYDKAVAYAELGNVYDQLGSPGKSIPVFDLALELVGDGLPETAVGKLLSIGFNAFRTIVIPAGWQKYRSEDKQRLAMLREAVWSRAWVNHVDGDGLLAGFDACVRTSIAAFQFGNPHSVAMSHATSALAWSSIGCRWPGSLFLSRSKRSNSRTQDPVVEAQISLTQGFSSYWLGNLNDARIGLNRAVEDLERCGKYVDSLMATHMLRHIEAYLGRTSDERRAAERMKQLAYEVGNAQRICWGEYDAAAAHSRRGELPSALESMSRSYAALNRERQLHTKAIRDATHAYVMIQCSDHGSAKQLSANSWEKNCESYVLIDTAMFCIPLMVEAHSGSNWLEPLPTQDMKPLTRALRLATIFYFTLPNQQSHLLRVCGRAAMALGKPRKAIRKFEKAVKLSAKKGMNYQLSKSLLDLAAVKESGREENRAEAIRLLKEMESVIPRAESWLLGEQYDEAVVAPEFDLEAWEREHGPVGGLEVGSA